MDENLGWKFVYIAVIFSLFILAVAYFLISPRESTYFTTSPTEKIAEFKNTRVEGRKDGKPAWKFWAASGWTAKDQDTTYLYNVSRGQIYAKGKLAVDELAAPEVKVSRQADVIEAQKANLKIKQDRINTPRINVSVGGKIAVFPSGLNIKRVNGTVNVGTAEYHADNEELATTAGIRLSLKEGKISTRLKSDQAKLFMDNNKDILLAGSLEVMQGKKISVADEGVYSRAKNSLLLKGRTKTILEKGGALLKEESIRHLNDPQVKTILKGKTVVTAQQIIFSTKTGDARASGRVEVSQKGKTARSEEAAYDEKNELLTLSGRVYLKQGDEWISCQQVVISIKKETFEASGVQAAKLKL